MSITKAQWGEVAGSPVYIYTLDNGYGLRAEILELGGIVVRLFTPDRRGISGDVVLGYDQFEPYLENPTYFGCLVGRYANRIGQARFTLDGKSYPLAANNKAHHLHGGKKGFHQHRWKAEAAESDSGPRLTLRRISPDGEEGYPGALTVEAVYTLTRDNGLHLALGAETDAPTHCNLTQHSYFNLRGSGSVLDHNLQIFANEFTPCDEDLIPTGARAPVGGTPLDFRDLHRIGERVEADHETTRVGDGYDHNFVLGTGDGKVVRAARVVESVSGRVLDVYTDAPGIQFYDGSFLAGTPGKGGATYAARDGFCLEPQHFPDSPNRPEFPSSRLNPGERYTREIEYRFSAM